MVRARHAALLLLALGRKVGFGLARRVRLRGAVGTAADAEGQHGEGGQQD
jgi:hypothetical protein